MGWRTAFRRRFAQALLALHVQWKATPRPPPLCLCCQGRAGSALGLVSELINFVGRWSSRRTNSTATAPTSPQGSPSFVGAVPRQSPLRIGVGVGSNTSLYCATADVTPHLARPLSAQGCLARSIRHGSRCFYNSPLTKANSLSLAPKAIPVRAINSAVCGSIDDGTAFEANDTARREGSDMCPRVGDWSINYVAPPTSGACAVCAV